MRKIKFLLPVILLLVSINALSQKINTDDFKIDSISQHHDSLGLVIVTLEDVENNKIEKAYLCLVSISADSANILVGFGAEKEPLCNHYIDIWSKAIKYFMDKPKKFVRYRKTNISYTIKEDCTNCKRVKKRVVKKGAYFKNLKSKD